jgi:AraC-like DNA-binding protein
LQLTLHSFAPISATRLKEFAGHRHRETEIVIGLSGVLGIRLETMAERKETEHSVKVGELFLIPPNAKHYFFEVLGPVAYYNIIFESDAKSIFLDKPVKLDKKWLCHFSTQDWKRGDDFESMMLSLLELLSQLRKTQPQVPSKQSSTTKKHSQPFSISENLTQLISQNPASQHSLQALAKHFGRDPSSLTTLSKKITGYSLLDLYHRIKIQMAQELLKSGKSIKEVSLDLGFANPFHFSKKFKSITGYSPSKYWES